MSVGTRGDVEADRGGARVREKLPASARALVERIGETPLLPLPSPRREVRILGKAEWLNPGGSVKDRPAWSMVRAALEEGRLPGARLLDASSGNTAIAYAMLGAAAGFGVTICLPESASAERVRTLRAYGAELVLTDPVEGSDGAIRRAREMAAARPERFWYADQYGNPANPEAHARTTGPEIVRETAGEVTHFVAGLGTTGTMMGTGRHLREAVPGVELVGVEPATSLHGIEGMKHLATALRPSLWDPSILDGRIEVSTEEATEGARRLAAEAGLLVGASAGAAWTACRRLARRIEAGTIVTVLPDGGERYLSEPWMAPGPHPAASGGSDGTPPRLSLPAEVVREMASRAARTYPREVCGVLLGRVSGSTRRVQAVRTAENRWPDRDDRYLVDPGTLRELLRREEEGGPRVLGFYHSHPDAEAVPSETDREHAWPWYVYHIVPARDGTAGEGRAWTLDGPEGRFRECEVVVRAPDDGG